MKKIALIAGALLSLNVSTATMAQDVSYVSLGLGSYNAFRSEQETDVRVEYRHGSGFTDYDIRPFAAIEYTDDDSLWLGVGIYHDFFLTNSIYLTPSLGAGYYDKGDSELDLSGDLQFRSQIELGYQFQNKSRVSFGISHLSNASTSGSNKGTEVASLYYHLPL